MMHGKLSIHKTGTVCLSLTTEWQTSSGRRTSDCSDWQRIRNGGTLSGPLILQRNSGPAMQNERKGTLQGPPGMQPAE
jgi:hypothetical protein